MSLDKFRVKFPLMIDSLVSAANNGRLSHAYLLHGDNSDTINEFSIGFAQLAGCLKRQMDGNSCGTCAACRQIKSGTYPDLFILSPVSKSRKIQIGKDSDDPDSIREFQSFFHLSPSFPNGKKIGILYDAECMTPSAQNAFLKTLEEPPGNSILILCSSRPQILLTTIRSRCQALLILDNKYSYNLPSSEKLLDTLRQLSFAERGDLVVAEKCASALIEIFSDIKKDSADNVDHKWEKRLDDLDKIDSSLKKKVKDKIEGEAAAEYMGHRSTLLSALHSWFGQLYIMSRGIPAEQLPNPELLAPLSDGGFTLDDKKTYRDLIRVEELLQNLSWSVDEALAIREFCLRIVM